MRIILKPAGLLLLLGVLVVLTTQIIARQQKARLQQLPETAPIAAFKSKKAKEKSATGVFDSKEKMVVVNLTEAGTTDWVHWGFGGSKGVTRKATAKKLIGDLKLVKPEAGLLPEGQRGPSRGLVWRDGTPTKSVDLTYAGVHVGSGNGFIFTVPAETREQTLTVYVGGLKAGGEFLATVAGGPQPEITKEDVALGIGYYSRMYKVKFQGSAPGQKLQVTWRLASGGGNISLQAASLK